MEVQDFDRMNDMMPNQSPTIYTAPWENTPVGKYWLHENGEIFRISVELDQHTELWIMFHDKIKAQGSAREPCSIDTLGISAILKPRLEEKEK